MAYYDYNPESVIVNQSEVQSSDAVSEKIQKYEEFVNEVLKNDLKYVLEQRDAGGAVARTTSQGKAKLRLLAMLSLLQVTGQSLWLSKFAGRTIHFMTTTCIEAWQNIWGSPPSN